MSMSVGMLDHYNVSTRKLADTDSVLRRCARIRERAAAAFRFSRSLALQRRPSGAARQRHLADRYRLNGLIPA